MLFEYGDMVDTFVYVGCEKIKTGSGKVVRVCSGYCDVDHCYPYAAPHVYSEHNTHLEKQNKETNNA